MASNQGHTVLPDGRIMTNKAYDRYIEKLARDIWKKATGKYQLSLIPWAGQKPLPQDPLNLQTYELQEILGRKYIRVSQNKCIKPRKNEDSARKRAEGLVEKVVGFASQIPETEISIKVECQGKSYKEEITFSHRYTPTITTKRKPQV